MEISGIVLPFISEKQCKQQLNPIEFISYFKEASFVVTSSFHGTAFSLIFQKEFYVIGMGHLADRSASLLGIAGRPERLLSEKTMNVPIFEDVADWQNGLSNYVHLSQMYINTILA